MSHRILYFGLDPSHHCHQSAITHFPLIEIVPRPVSDLKIIDALSRFHDYSHVLITSKSTIPLLSNLLTHFGFSLADWQSKETLAIGKVTAAFLKESSITPSFIAKDETSEGLIKELIRFNWKDKHIFWPHSSISRKIIPEFFENHQIQSTECSLYDTRPIESQILPLLDEFDELVFTSPSTVDAFLLNYKTLPTQKVLTPIGPVTASYLNKFLFNKALLN